MLNELAIDDFAQAEKVDAEAVAQMKALCGEIVRGEVSATTLRTILAGVTHDAIVLTEASCLVLRYPKAHMRIVMS